jgi:hypothetical protein
VTSTAGWPLVLDTDEFVVFELRGALLALFGADDLGRDAHATQLLGSCVVGRRQPGCRRRPSRRRPMIAPLQLYR